MKKLLLTFLLTALSVTGFGLKDDRSEVTDRLTDAGKVLDEITSTRADWSWPAA